MRGLINDLLRHVISICIRLLGLCLQYRQRIQIHFFARNQRRLKRRFGITPQTPVLPYGEAIEQLINAAAKAQRYETRFAMTSGSTGRPKRLLYTNRRLKTLKRYYCDVFARACWSFGLKRTSLYVFSSYTPDDSLTTMLLDESRLPAYLSTLQAPYRVQHDEVFRELVSSYGDAAVRLWILTLSNPGFLYSTNPSSMVSFFDEINSDWLKSKQLAKDWHERRETFNRRLRSTAGRIDSRGSSQRVEAIAKSDAPLPLTVWAPQVCAYMCWTGGYVKPFLDRLLDYLPAHKYRLIPMFSMSTETVETLTCFHGQRISFLPMADSVVYEFIEEGKADEQANLLSFDQLQVGRSYSMIVSDVYGLRRYQTDDLFHCDDTILGMPSLSFLRRRGLEHSFTGEKLTGEQLNIVFEELRKSHVEIFQNTFLTCVPCPPLSAARPYYQILAIGETATPDFSSQCDQRLCELNIEYKAKRLSGRLGGLDFVNVTSEEFSEVFPRSVEPQFKYLPLYRGYSERSASVLPRRDSNRVAL
jgi:hypothetical protein